MTRGSISFSVNFIHIPNRIFVSCFMHAFRRLTVFSPFAAFLIMLFSGCGGGETTHPVAGTVMKGSEPLKTGTVTFVPDTSKGNESGQEAVGTIENGKYSVAIPGAEGAPPGWYKVLVRSDVPVDPNDEYSITKPAIDQKYGNPANTPLAVEVVADPADGAYDLKVQ